ncbi:hypothetical protein EAH72_17415 [Pseudomonas caspiana]|nr:hypothetical protein [Pseudomonas caspiana]TPG94702.1 hypothetical protein EAH72_17415 [Pseudomonas caspiana]
MSVKKKNLMVVALCTLMLAGASIVPGESSLISMAHAKEGGGNGGGHGGGNGAGNGGGSGSGHSGGVSGNSSGRGLNGDHAGKAVKDGGISGKHYGSTRTIDKDHASVTSGVAKSKDTRGLSKATSISSTTPGEHNTKGLSNAGTSTTKNDK